MPEILVQLGVGGLFGYGVGLALKKMLKLFLIIVGLFFLSLEVLDFFGFITIEWERVTGLFNSPATGDAANSLFEGIKNIVLRNAAVIVGFTPGLIWGIRRG